MHLREHLLAAVTAMLRPGYSLQSLSAEGDELAAYEPDLGVVVSVDESRNLALLTLVASRRQAADGYLGPNLQGGTCESTSWRR